MRYMTCFIIRSVLPHSELSGFSCKVNANIFQGTTFPIFSFPSVFDLYQLLQGEFVSFLGFADTVKANSKTHKLSSFVKW